MYTVNTSSSKAENLVEDRKSFMDVPVKMAIKLLKLTIEASFLNIVNRSSGNRTRFSHKVEASS